MNEDDDVGPVSEIMRIHKAFRIELDLILKHTHEIRSDGTIPDPNKLVSLAQGVAFLREMVADHSEAEDTIILPRLEERVPGISRAYYTDHVDERKIFEDLAECLQDLQCIVDEEKCKALVERAHALAQSLRDDMVLHLNREETHMWPVLKTHFSKEEQTQVISLIYGQMPAFRFQQLLPWMIRLLSVAEGNIMMSHIMKVTQSTMFESWLKTWLPSHDEQQEQQQFDNNMYDITTNGNHSCDYKTSNGSSPVALSARFRNRTVTSNCFQLSAKKNTMKSFTCTADRRNSSTQNREDGSASTALAMLNGKETMEETIRAIARDASLSIEERTRMMQQVMLAPYNNHVQRLSSTTYNNNNNSKNENSNVTLASSFNGNNNNFSTLTSTFVHAQQQEQQGHHYQQFDDRTRTYGTAPNGEKRLGCRHYLRGCKLRSSCCNKLYTCRLCHDDAEQTHIMDRYATTEIFCMYCGTTQPVARRCVNPECGKEFARYFCGVCKFYDDTPGRNIYHCPSCNVCRAGKGLGKDFFHCMKCNQCMSMKYRDGHKCIERAMESDCPVCHQYLFTSVRPIKTLKCGHLMHTICYAKFVQQQGVRCPICSTSLEEVRDLYNAIDEQFAHGALAMPARYRDVRCEIYCLDCHRRSTRSYHFIFNKCTLCNSYNTRVDYIDANPATEDTTTVEQPFHFLPSSSSTPLQ